MSENEYNTFKIAVCGDSKTGKSSLCLNLTEKYHVVDPYYYVSTIGIDIMVLKLHSKTKLILYDYAGDVRFTVITGSYTRHCSMIIYVYNMENPSTLDRIRRIRAMHENTLNIEQCKFLVVGTRKESYNRKCTNEGIEFAESIGVKHIEVSNLNRTGIPDVIQYLREQFKEPLEELQTIDLTKESYINKLKQGHVKCCIL